jgi:hypothetical protein
MTEFTNFGVVAHAGTLSPLEPINPLSGLVEMAQSNYASAAWPTANLAFYYGVVVLRPLTIYQIGTSNGATASGNVDVGIYDFAGNRLVSSGSTAQSGTSVGQVFDITDTVLTPGNYFLAMAVDNITATFFRVSPSTEQLRCNGVYQQASAFPLPSTATFATPTAGYSTPIYASVVPAL